MDRLTLLVTGGAGVVGESLLKCLDDRYRVICLARRSDINIPGVEVLRGDIRHPTLGLCPEQYATLAKRVDWIVHSAAVTRLDGEGADIHDTNYIGTANIVQFSQRANAPLYHISTAYTHACDYYEGVPPETAYERAKKLAERLVIEAGIPVSIFKPSMVIGDATTGVMPNFQGFHMTLALSMSGILPVIPCPPEAYADVIARDVVARAIKHALDRRLLGGSFYLTSGDKAPTVLVLSQLLAEAAALGGQAYAAPRFMSPDVFERLLKPVFLPALDPGLQASLLRAAHMLRYGCLRAPLPSSIPSLMAGHADAGRDPTEELRQSIRFLQPKVGAFRRLMKAGASRSKASNMAQADAESPS